MTIQKEDQCGIIDEFKSEAKEKGYSVLAELQTGKGNFVKVYLEGNRIVIEKA